VKGWFDDTLPALDRPLDVVLLDVDLVASTRTCLRWLYPASGPAAPSSQDGHLRATIALLEDSCFWRDDGRRAADDPRLGTRKLLEIPAAPDAEIPVGAAL
jgi:hypothetical protein